MGRHSDESGRERFVFMPPSPEERAEFVEAAEAAPVVLRLDVHYQPKTDETGHHVIGVHCEPLTAWAWPADGPEMERFITVLAEVIHGTAEQLRNIAGRHNPRDN